MLQPAAVLSSEPPITLDDIREAIKAEVGRHFVEMPYVNIFVCDGMPEQEWYLIDLTGRKLI